MWEPESTRELRALFAAAAVVPLLMCGRLGPTAGSSAEAPPLAPPAAEG
ncbi:MAG: hypothetical protein R2724_13115 [Bryobacterales bacterium]